MSRIRVVMCVGRTGPAGGSVREIGFRGDNRTAARGVPGAGPRRPGSADEGTEGMRRLAILTAAIVSATLLGAGVPGVAQAAGPATGGGSPVPRQVSLTAVSCP